MIKQLTSKKNLNEAYLQVYRNKGEKGKYQFVVKKSKWKEFKSKLKHLTKKTIPMTFDERIERINWLIRGWINYFKLASMQAKLKKLEEWLRIKRSESRIQNNYKNK